MDESKRRMAKLTHGPSRQKVSPVARRQAALRRLLDRGQASTQEELREGLVLQKFDVNQSTISRDLRKIGAIKAIDSDGRTTYRLPPSESATIEGPQAGLDRQILKIAANSAMLVIQTRPGSASLVARVIDQSRLAGVLGTIAGDDTVFLALENGANEMALIRQLDQLFRGLP
jgi:transcriptional regulator of arginine metabolism